MIDKQIEHPKMRRKDRELPHDDAYKLLQDGEYGILSTSDGQGICYGTPMSYVAEGGGIFLHCAKQGKKLDNIKDNPNVCFTVVAGVSPVYDGGFTTYYESVMVFGTAYIIENPKEREAALAALCNKYLPQHMDKVKDALEKGGPQTCVVGIKINHITGKAKRKA